MRVVLPVAIKGQVVDEKSREEVIVRLTRLSQDDVGNEEEQKLLSKLITSCDRNRRIYEEEVAFLGLVRNTNFKECCPFRLKQRILMSLQDEGQG